MARGDSARPQIIPFEADCGVVDVIPDGLVQIVEGRREEEDGGIEEYIYE